ncbi:hypothetical protein [Vibrio algicola]|uniref:hypothetical protein n=1 Tax=Vibrio algicola TaxID=2662262 RepID=UPI001CEDBE5B|nr:hypothetical protein [Vibrio algicola]
MQSTAATTSMGAATVTDGQLTKFRATSGKSDAWVKHADKNNGKGDVGSSKDTAFDAEGSARIRFMAAGDDFSVTPGLSQVITNIQPNTDYTLSMYYYDKKGAYSPSELELGVKKVSGESLAGSTIESKEVHAKDLNNSPRGEVKTGFRQTTLDFNSGSNTSVEIYALMHIIDADKIDKDGDIGKQTEVRIDEFSLTKK